MKKEFRKVYELKEHDVFIMNNVEYIVTTIHNGLVFYIETGNRDGISKFMSEHLFKVVEVYTPNITR